MPDLRFMGPNPTRANAKLEHLFVNGGTLTANNTTKFYLPPVGRKCKVVGLSYVCTVKPADADGTILATVAKWNGAAETTLTNPLDLEAVTVRIPASARPNAAGDAVVQANESLLINVVNNSAAIDTQMTNGIFSVEIAIID